MAQLNMMEHILQSLATLQTSTVATLSAEVTENKSLSGSVRHLEPSGRFSSTFPRLILKSTRR